MVKTMTKFIVSPYPSASDSQMPVAGAQNHQADQVRDLQIPVGDDDDDQQHPKLKPAGCGLNPSDAHNSNSDNSVVDWPAKVIGFCFTWAAAIATFSLQSSAPLPVRLQIVSFATVVAVTLLYISNYLYHHPKSPNQDQELAQVIERVGVFFGVAAFIYAVSIPSPLYLKLIHWAIFLLPVLAFILYNRTINHVLLPVSQGC